ncbi:hypothetical protein BaRGS_00008772 [Batillaria attramentaria]|uniref:Uncharacterized protein n=1 Tax=Batillaria attramentaria TaxID=370345 RepID=A0ABD0LK77_9CAEN
MALSVLRPEPDQRRELSPADKTAGSIQDPSPTTETPPPCRLPVEYNCLPFFPHEFRAALGTRPEGKV